MTIAFKTSACALLAACLLVCSTAAARAEYYVPPSNSAVNQYTQSIPSAGGDKSGEGKGVTAAEAIGAGNAKKLHKEGPDGSAAAQLAAETAPAPIGAASEEAPSSKSAGKHKKAKHHAKKPPKNGGEKESKPAGNGGGSRSGPSNGAGSSASAQGASAGGELVSQATGLSGGTLGIFLPLVIVAALIWAGAYLLRRRRGLDHSAA
jgi:hypothetical protein